MILILFLRKREILKINGNQTFSGRVNQIEGKNVQHATDTLDEKKSCINLNGKQFSIVFKRFLNEKKKNKINVVVSADTTEYVLSHVKEIRVRIIMAWPKIYRVSTE